MHDSYPIAFAYIDIFLPYTPFSQTVQSRGMSTTAPSILDSIFSRTRTPGVSMDELYPDVEVPTVYSTQASKPEITTLPSGLRVVTQTSSAPVNPAICVIVKSGSRYETDGLEGINSFIERMILKSTSNRSFFRLMRETGRTGVSLSASSSRETFSVLSNATPDQMEVALGTVADQICNPIFSDREVHEESHRYLEDAAERVKNVDTSVDQALHSAAFGGETLGRPSIGNAASFHNISSSILKEYHSAFFTPDRVVVSATGVEHKDFVASVSQLFGGLPKLTQPILESRSQYVGGEIRQTTPDYQGPSYIALGFKGPGWHGEGLHATCVLQTLMGGGSSYSSGGPGKGMHSRLYQNVLRKYSDVDSAVAFNSIYSDNSLFGIYASTEAKSIGTLTDVLVSELHGMTQIKDEQEFERAKKQTISALVHSLDSSIARAEEAGLSVAMFNKNHVDNTIEKIRNVTVADVQKAAGALLKTPLTLVTYGNAKAVPRYDILQKRF